MHAHKLDWMTSAVGYFFCCRTIGRGGQNEINRIRYRTNGLSYSGMTSLFCLSVPKSTYIPRVRVPQYLSPCSNWDPPPTLSPPSECPPPLRNQRGETHSPASEFQFWRLEKKLSTVSTLWSVLTIEIQYTRVTPDRENWNWDERRR
jgi:hypothetical protein